jgi:hypothetical protein
MREVFVTSGPLRHAFRRCSLGDNAQFCKLSNGVHAIYDESIARDHAYKGRR